MGVPAIPSCLHHRPVQGGLVVPDYVVQLPDGTYDFAACEQRKVNLAMLDRLCGVCGHGIVDGRTVFFAAEDQLGDLVFDSPPLHPACAAYSAQVCPMTMGVLSEYRSKATRATTSGHQCFEEGCDCGGWIRTGPVRCPGTKAPAWFAVWCNNYDVIVPGNTPKQVRAIVRTLSAGYAVAGVRVRVKVRTAARVRPLGREAAGALPAGMG